MVAVFQPLLQADKNDLELNAAVYYNQIRKSKLSKRVKKILQDVFESLLEQRFKDKDKQEVEQMFLGALPDLRDTRSGKDLIKIGFDEGEIAGKRRMLMLVLKGKFGRVPRDARKYILNLNDANKLDELAIQIAQSTSLDQLKW